MIKSIISTLSLLWILLVGTQTTDKVRLEKKPTKEDHLRNFNCWIQRNFYIIALAAILICLFVFILVCFVVVGVSTVESGTVYNHLNDII